MFGMFDSLAGVIMFEYELNQLVMIMASSESGVVVARAQYVGSQNQYLIRYKNGMGCAVEQWWAADSIAEYLNRVLVNVD
jgi:hypothetical protein